MKHYKIRHTPSGLFYTPNKKYYSHVFEEKHLSKVGKIYARVPSASHVCRTPVEEVTYPITDFEIVEYQAVETQKIQF